MLEKLLYLLDGSKFIRTSAYLQDNFTPVHKQHTPQPSLPILQGTLPPDLQGAFCRNGPNPYFPVEGRYHWFDGDGMIHCIKLPGDGTAFYSNAFVDTAKLAQEKKAGYASCGKFGDDKGVSGILHILLILLKKRAGVVDMSQGLGTANTALTYHAQRLLALHEGDLPYHLRIACDGILSTVGRWTFGGALPTSTTSFPSSSSKTKETRPATFTAHPKIDPMTGEMFALGYSVEHAPYLWFTRITKDGTVEADFPIPGLRGPVMMHDMAITERYVVFVDAPLFFRPEAMVKHGSLPFKYEGEQAMRLGVLDRYASSGEGVIWIDLEPGMCFHVANAWDEKERGRLVVYLCRFSDFSLDDFSTEISPEAEPKLYRVDLEVGEGVRVGVQSRMTELSGDFPTVPASRVGRPTKYAYLALMKSVNSTPKFYGVAKVDLTATPGSEQAVKGVVTYGQGRWGGECSFVPRSHLSTISSTSNTGTNEKEVQDEDDGYLCTFVYDDAKQESEFVVYDAKSMSEVPVGRVGMGCRVPYGFHGTWLTQEQLDAQK